jgi:hypothetical protein
MRKKHIKSFALICLAFFSFALARSVLAQSGVVPAPSGGGEGDYTLNDFVVLAINVSQIILGLVGSLTLAMFVYGGVMFMISAGSSEKISKAKNIIVAALIGLIIVFSSWILIRFVVSSLGVDDAYQFNGTLDVQDLSF